MAPKSKFVGATLVATNLMETKFYNADFANAKMEGNRIPYAIWEGVHMENCTGCPVDW
ncbi:pentapeptide repeat-containing protein [Paracoccus cavernae]|uniref:Pentapeptide repeat-containing protein n=2 Tax=Paracoccus cavernae TaxID=1571207 RepID=A0ABT8DAV5_9RHOB|nr:pentapeptide repeat-containing protein [Paracoccus cavernae]